jgi:hypothetical protein
MWSLLARCWSVVPVKAPLLEPSITDVAKGGPAIFGSIYLPYGELLHGLFRDFAKYATFEEAGLSSANVYSEDLPIRCGVQLEVLDRWSTGCRSA